MSRPVTRGELRDELDAVRADFKAELERFATKQDLERFATKADLAAALVPYATKADLERYATRVDLELWGGALMARIERSEETLFTRIERTLMTELARHTRAIQEGLAVQIAVVDEKYRDLPARVARLEDQVSGPKRGTRR